MLLKLLPVIVQLFTWSATTTSARQGLLLLRKDHLHLLEPETVGDTGKIFWYQRRPAEASGRARRRPHDSHWHMEDLIGHRFTVQVLCALAKF